MPPLPLNASVLKPGHDSGALLNEAPGVIFSANAGPNARIFSTPAEPRRSELHDADSNQLGGDCFQVSPNSATVRMCLRAVFEEV